MQFSAEIVFPSASVRSLTVAVYALTSFDGFTMTCAPSASPCAALIEKRPFRKDAMSSLRSTASVLYVVLTVISFSAVLSVPQAATLKQTETASNSANSVLQQFFMLSSPQRSPAFFNRSVQRVPVL